MGSTKEFTMGDILYAPNYVKVIGKTSEDSYKVKDMFTGVKYYLQGAELVNIYLGCLTYSHVKYVTLSELVEKFLSTQDGSVFTVGFVKVDETLRVLRGKYVNEETLFGRTRVIDFDHDKEYRLVDHRTLQFLVVNNVCYMCNKITVKNLNVNDELSKF